MLKPNDIKSYSDRPETKQKDLEILMQSDDLHYLSSLSFEQFDVSDNELENLSKQISDSVPTSANKLFQTVFISVLCGLMLGISIFFIIFHKNKNHPSVWQIFDSEHAIPQKTLNNNIKEFDTIFPIIEQKHSIKKEHFHSTENQIEMVEESELPDMLSTINNSLTVAEAEDHDIVLQFIPNAPVIFIHQMKITNYKGYYYKQSAPVDLGQLTGLSAEYESAVNQPLSYQKVNRAYLATKIIKNAMRLFNSKNYINCIEELMLLYNYNNDDANAQFYLGMCFYLTGKYSTAQVYFTKNLDNQNNIFHQESEFYQSLCYIHTNQKELGIKQLQHIVDNKGFYSKRAEFVLAKGNDE